MISTSLKAVNEMSNRKEIKSRLYEKTSTLFRCLPVSPPEISTIFVEMSKWEDGNDNNDDDDDR